MSRKKMGDRRDGVWLKDIDSMHVIMPFLYPNRCDNEAFISQSIDVTNLLEYIDEKNKNEGTAPYTLFHAFIAAFCKTLVLRPKMNRFVKRNRIYQRNSMSAAFTVKKQFSDKALEALAFMPLSEDDTIDSIHQKLVKEISMCKSDEQKDNSTNAMDIMKKLPFPVLSFLMWCYHKLDKYGLVPQALVKTDPNQATVFLSNFGSIGLPAGYHHLTNWGTNSIFAVVGKMYEKPVFSADGSFEMRKTVDLGLTIDERIADGFYYAKTIRILKYILENPQLLDTPAKEEIDYAAVKRTMA